MQDYCFLYIAIIQNQGENRARWSLNYLLLIGFGTKDPTLKQEFMSLQSAIFKVTAFLRKTNDHSLHTIVITIAARKETKAHGGMQNAIA